jgi:hypothetical protein
MDCTRVAPASWRKQVVCTLLSLTALSTLASIVRTGGSGTNDGDGRAATSVQTEHKSRSTFSSFRPSGPLLSVWEPRKAWSIFERDEEVASRTPGLASLAERMQTQKRAAATLGSGVDGGVGGGGASSTFELPAESVCSSTGVVEGKGVFQQICAIEAEDAVNASPMASERARPTVLMVDTSGGKCVPSQSPDCDVCLIYSTPACAPCPSMLALAHCV